MASQELLRSGEALDRGRREGNASVAVALNVSQAGRRHEAGLSVG